MDKYIHKYVLDSSYSTNTARRKEAVVCAAHRTYISDVLHIAQLPNLDSFLGVGRREFPGDFWWIVHDQLAIVQRR